MISSAESSETVGFAALDARLREAVRTAATSDPDPADPLRGLYISDEQAIELAAGPLRARGEEGLAAVAARLELDALDAAVLGLCVAPELHPHYGRMFGYLHDDVTRRLASPRVVADLLAGEGVTHADVLSAFAPRAVLRVRGALEVIDDGQAAIPLADRPVKVADRLVGLLVGMPAEPRDAGRARRVDPVGGLAGREASVGEIAVMLRSHTRLPLVVCGSDAAALVAEALGSGVLLVPVTDAARPEVMTDAALACALEGRRLCFDGLDELEPAQRGRLHEVLDRLPEPPVFVAPSRRSALALGDRAVLTLDVPMPSFAERERAWGHLCHASDTRDVAAKFRLSVDQISDAAEVARVVAHARGEPTPTPADLDAGARQASSSGLGELATRLASGYRWADLVLPDRQRNLLHSVSAYLRHRDRVLSDWGYERAVARSQGLKVLFAGESGCGKTMAAQVLASELGLELFRIDLATVVSKYIGETEKNLSRVFAAAHGSNAVLFFDEADALFGKRSEISDSHDRYANIEVAFLLQEMETYSGAVILATNLRRNIDDAFIRRLDFVIDFPFPEPDDRRRIWQALLPDEAPKGPDIDLDFLANRFKLSGGAIRNCSLAAAFQAADEDEPIHMRHLVRSVAQEYAKQGRLTLESDFERFHALVRHG